jgi:hypothetical protein
MRMQITKVDFILIRRARLKFLRNYIAERQAQLPRTGVGVGTRVGRITERS